ncbi:MAG: class I SAM-dependent methyltransferase [Ignavibacteriae bacterium]|nr:class I SAM-dependent methyltransferase [Ignavibacteriota bacterium]MCB9216558.1 class I SAM-dependent methyltransferase [Ignavibacteria bacterium]
MYHLSAKYYDYIYSFKDYEKESAILRGMIETYGRSDGNQLLDVACGTGKHIEYLREDFEVEGVDLEPEFLKIVQEKFPDLSFYLGDMRTFDLGREFDVVTCLFSAIGYMQTVEELNLAIANMARHLRSGGMLLVEPWISRDKWRDSSVHMLTVDEPELKIARVVTSSVEGRTAVMDMHHLIGTPEKTQHFVETHRMFMATKEELMDAVQSAGLKASWDEEGLNWRGMLIGVKE